MRASLLLLILALGLAAGAARAHDPAPGGRGLVPNHAEDAAVARGAKLGIGSAALDGPESAEVLSHQTWTFVYTAGKAGIQPGGGVRVGMRHVSHWSVPQTTDPKAVGYCTAATAGGQPVQLSIAFDGRFFKRYFPWQQMVEVLLPTRGLAPGEQLQLVYGDRGGGSPGMRVQPFDETCFVFKTYVDALGEGDYLPLGPSPSIEVVAAAPRRLQLVMPSDAVVGKPTWCLARAEDRYGNPASRYRGTVHLQATDNGAQLPPAHTFTPADCGVHRFEGVVFRTSGCQRLTLNDGTRQATANPVRVAHERPERLLLWGDLHGHTLLSDGRGTVAQFYQFAEHVAGLDFCAVTDHGFQVRDEMWEHSKRVTNRVYRPGRFVTFQAFEWSGITPLGGDHNCYFLEDDPPIFRSTSYYTPANLQMHHGPGRKQKHVTDVFAELEQRLRDKNVLCIPHYGGRPGNPQWHDPKVQRMIEIFSEHRRSEDWAGTFLTKGYRLGIIASTDNHHGNPGYGYLRPTGNWHNQEIGMAAVAVSAPRRTRESIFRALYDRCVYATSGDRIVLDFHVDGHPMGTEFRTTAPPTLTVEATGTAAIALIEVKKNSNVVAAFTPGEVSATIRWQDDKFRADESCYYYVRLVQRNNEEAISSPVWVN